MLEPRKWNICVNGPTFHYKGTNSLRNIPAKSVRLPPNSKKPICTQGWPKVSSSPSENAYGMLYHSITKKVLGKLLMVQKSNSAVSAWWFMVLNSPAILAFTIPILMHLSLWWTDVLRIASTGQEQVSDGLLNSQRFHSWTCLVGYVCTKLPWILTTETFLWLGDYATSCFPEKKEVKIDVERKPISSGWLFFANRHMGMSQIYTSRRTFFGGLRAYFTKISSFIPKKIGFHLMTPLLKQFEQNKQKKGNQNIFCQRYPKIIPFFFLPFSLGNPGMLILTPTFLRCNIPRLKKQKEWCLQVVLREF